MRDNEEQVELSAAPWIAGALTIGAYVSRGLIEYVPVAWFRLAFGLIMIFVATRFILDSDSELRTAAAGIAAVVLASLGYVVLKRVGRRYLPPPSLGEQLSRSMTRTRRAGLSHMT